MRKLSIYGQLQKIDISGVVNQIVDLMLPRDVSNVNKIFMVSIRFTIENYKTGFGIDKMLHLIYYRPNNYTFVGKVDKDYLTEESVIKFLSNHDSCWGQDGTNHSITEFVKELEKELDSSKKRGNDDDLSIYNTIFSTSFFKGSVKIDNNNNYSVKFIKA